MAKDSIKGKAWVIAADMGYGHQRTAYPLKDTSPYQEIINANNYAGMPEKDKKIWRQSKAFYEFASRFRRIPIIGILLFIFLDSFQRIMGYYPKRDLSKSSFSLKMIFSLIRKGWGRDLIKKLNKNPVPIITTFFTPAFMAEYNDYLGEIYCVICDADIARSWVPLNPQKSEIKYFAPCSWARDRLKLYGVKHENIIFTGYPLPKENIGGQSMAVLKKDLSHRIVNLDPKGKYRRLYSPLLKRHLGQLPKFSNHPLTLMFSIGGAGAQKEIALEITNNLKEEIKAKKLRMIISVGTRKELEKYFAEGIKGLHLDGWVHVIYGNNIAEYF
ncbi:MAG: hypothetical protein AAB877_03775, partial [Patescibacteria group bacterium]